MTKPSILVTCGHLQRHLGLYNDEIKANGFETIVPRLESQQFSESEMRALVRHADVVIAGDDPLTDDVLRAGTTGKLKGVVRWGIGTDNVDLPAAAALGLPVYNTPGMFNNEVADLALGHIIALSRHLMKMDRDVRAGKWTRYEGTSLTGKTVGVVGLGGIGREVAKRCNAFGMTVIGSDLMTIDSGALKHVGAQQVSFDEVLQHSDIIVFACALTPQSYHMLDDAALSKAKRGVMIVNVARGSVIEEAALIRALHGGIVGAAGLDVFETEPLPMDSELRRFDNTLFGTHSGSSTTDAIKRTNRTSVRIALAMLGHEPHFLATCNRVA